MKPRRPPNARLSMHACARALCLALALGAAAGTAAAQCPPAPDISADEAAALAGLRAAGSEAEARVFTDRLWRLWTTAPDAHAQALLDRGMRARAQLNFATALERFNALIVYCPHYAEGWNQRAFIRFARGDFAGALADLDRAIALSPNHIAAISGRGLALMRLGRAEDGRKEILRALAMHPFLPERRYLSDNSDNL